MCTDAHVYTLYPDKTNVCECWCSAVLKYLQETERRSESNGLSGLLDGTTQNAHVCATIIILGSCHKYHFYHDKSFFRDKYVFVATKHVFCRDKNDTCGSPRK